MQQSGRRRVLGVSVGESPQEPPPPARRIIRRSLEECDGAELTETIGYGNGVGRVNLQWKTMGKRIVDVQIASDDGW